MKKNIVLTIPKFSSALLTIGILSGCAQLQLQPPQWPQQILPVQPAAPIVPATPDPLTQRALFDASQNLAQRVATGELSRLQAADELNQVRITVVGNNPLDDEIFAFYRNLTAQVQAGTLTQTRLRQQLKQRLKFVREQRLAAQQPQTPVFTNFLLQTIYDQPPL